MFCSINNFVFVLFHSRVLIDPHAFPHRRQHLLNQKCLFHYLGKLLEFIKGLRDNDMA